MYIFITDNPQIYSNSKEASKLLFKNYIFTESNFINSDELNKFNSSLNLAEVRAEDLMIKELNSYINNSGIKDKSFVINKYLATRNKADIAFTFLYNDFKKFITNKHLFLFIVQKLLLYFKNFFPIDFLKFYFTESSNLILLGDETDIFKYPTRCYMMELDNDSLIPLYISHDLKVNNIPSSSKRIKNIGYSLFNLFNKTFKNYSSSFNIKNKTHILLLMHKSQKELDLLDKFLELVKNDSQTCLTVLLLHTLHDNDFYKNIVKLKSDNIRFLELTDFRNSITINHDDFYRFISKDYPQFAEADTIYKSLEIYYSWIGNAVKILKPDVCLYAKIDEPGRVLSDVARYHKIPSVNLEYAFTYDTDHINSNISFTIRAHISGATKAIWIKRKDPSLNHEIIGYCKLDSISDILPDKKSFFINNNFEETHKTILFASTWAGDFNNYDMEKSILINNLSEICHRNNWNLIIKKHPSEKDLIADKIIQEKNHPNQKVFTHNELKLEDAIQYSDFLCTQFSSVVLDALYFSKPFCYLSASNENNMSAFTLLINEPGIESFSDINLFENYLIKVFTTGYDKQLSEVISSLKQKYLFKTDGKASERLLTILKNSCK